MADIDLTGDSDEEDGAARAPPPTWTAHAARFTALIYRAGGGNGSVFFSILYAS